MEVILDTNFIISCMKKKIDFITELEEKGFKTVIPREVLQELKDLRQKVNREEKISIELALKLIENGKIKKIGLGAGKIDYQLIKKGQEGVYIATLDAAIKRLIPNRVVISNAKNALSVERS